MPTSLLSNNQQPLCYAFQMRLSHARQRFVADGGPLQGITVKSKAISLATIYEIASTLRSPTWRGSGVGRHRIRAAPQYGKPTIAAARSQGLGTTLRARPGHRVRDQRLL